MCSFPHRLVTADWPGGVLMSEKRPILGNILTFGLSSVTLVFLFLLAVIAARYLGPAEFGIFSFALAFVFFFDFLLDPGLYHLLIREISRDRGMARQYMLHAFVWKLVAFPVVFLMIALLVNMLHDEVRIHNTVYLIAVATFLKSVKDVFRSGLLANEQFGLEAISSFIEKGGLLLVGGIAVVMGYGLYALCWAFIGVRVLDLLVIALMSRRIYPVAHIRLIKAFLGDMLRSGIPIGVYYVTLNVYNYIDTMMVSVMRESTEVGWYSASYKVYEGLLIVPVIVGTVLLPRLSAGHDEDRENFYLLVGKGFKYVLILALVVMAAGIPLVTDVTVIVYGGDYAKSGITLEILLYGIAFAYLVNLQQTVMISINRQNALVVIAMVGLVLNVAMNVVAIYWYGYVGAAVVTVIVEALVCVLLYAYLLTRFPGILPVREVAMTAGCWALIAVIVTLTLGSLPVYLQSLAWVAGFVATIRVLGIIEDAEWQQAVAALRRVMPRIGTEA